MLFFLLLSPTRANGSSNVIINEVAWMGTEKSSNDEWMELLNSNDFDVSLEGWTIKSATGTLKIDLKGIIPANGLYLLERSDDETVPGVKADLIYTGALKNTGEILGLYDNSSNLVDSAVCLEGWPAGNNQTKQTMERIGPSEWQSSQNPGGTPKERNSATTIAQSPEELKQEYASGIVINEILPSPEGADSEKEWVEIFNQNDFEVDVSGWKIFDAVGTAKTYIFPENTKIIPEGFLVLPRPLTGITLNNEGDELKISWPNGETTDSAKYEKAPKGDSYNKAGSGWVWSAILTPGTANQVVAQTKEGEAKNSPSSKEQNVLSNRGLAEISKTLENNKEEKGGKPSRILLIALTISLFSGIVMSLLKEKTKQSN